MNNKHIFNQRLRSIEHYAQEVKALKEAQTVTQSTLDDLVDSMAEFCPFPDGSVIMKGDKIRKVIKCNSAGRDHTGSLYYQLSIANPTSGGWGNSGSTEVIHFKDVEKWTIFQDQKVEA